MEQNEMRTAGIQLFCWNLAGYQAPVVRCCGLLFNKFAGSGFIILLNCLVVMVAAGGYGWYFLGWLPGAVFVLPPLAISGCLWLNRHLCGVLQARAKWYRLVYVLILSMLPALFAALGFTFVLFSRELRLAGLPDTPDGPVMLLWEYLDANLTALVFVAVLTSFLLILFAFPYILIYAFRHSTYHQILRQYDKKRDAAGHG